MAIAILRQHSTLEVREEPISRQEVMSADEVWLSSSTKELEPVVAIDGNAVGTGGPGPVWSQAQALFAEHRFDHFA